MSDKALVLEGFVLGELVAIRVVHQDESLRGVGSIYHAKGDKFSIESESYPDLDPTVLYIQGSEAERDGEWAFCVVGSAKTARLLWNKIRRAVKAVNKKPAPAEAETQPETDDPIALFIEATDTKTTRIE